MQEAVDDLFGYDELLTQRSELFEENPTAPMEDLNCCHLSDPKEYLGQKD